VYVSVSFTSHNLLKLLDGLGGFLSGDFFDLSCTMLRGILENFQNRSNGSISGLFTGTFSQSFVAALRSSHRVVSLDRQDDVGRDKLATVKLG